MNMQFNFPRTIGIVNDSEENLSNVVVSQVEDMSGFSGMSACFDVVDQDGNSANKDLTIDYNGFGWVSNKCVIGGLGDTNVTADIGNYENGGYDKYLAIKTTGISGQFMGSDELSYYAHYTDKSGREYNVQLDYCNISESLLNKVIIGKFDAWDTDHNINDRNITTKIVNKEFNLTLASLDENDNLSKKQNINVKYSLIDMAYSKILIPWRDFNASQNEEINVSFDVNKAVKDVRVVFNVCSDYNGTDYTLYPYEKCSDQCILNDKQTNNNPCWRYFYSSDNFAIRPNKFKLQNIDLIKAGEFNLIVKALDYRDNSASNYNEMLTVEGSSPTLEYNDTKASKGCNRGDLNIVANANFVNGIANVTLKYDEVSELNLTLKEVNGSEFAKVDADDTPVNKRFVTEDSKIYTFIPHHFAIKNIKFLNGAKNFTYIANNLNMSGHLTFKITAQADDNNPTNNYTNKCYAKNIDINISHTVPKVDLGNSKLIYKEINSSKYEKDKDKLIAITSLTKSKFDSNGTAYVNIFINFEKIYSKPVEEFDFNITEINVSDVNNTFGSSDILNDKQINFRYGRIKVHNISGYSSELNTTFEYQYWDKNNGWELNKEHNETIFGDVNLSKSIYPKNDVIMISILQQSNKNILEGKENIKFNTTHVLPYSSKIHLSIPEWLWYHPLAKKYKAPSSSNLDCLTHPCMKVDFLKNSLGWGGVQAINNERFSEENRTSEMNVSRKDVNVSKSQVKKINW